MVSFTIGLILSAVHCDISVWRIEPRWTCEEYFDHSIFYVREPNVEWSIHRKMSLRLLGFVFRLAGGFIPRRYPNKDLNDSFWEAEIVNIVEVPA